LDRNQNFESSRSDFKYPSDFGFLKNCRIPSDSDADSDSVTSLSIAEFLVSYGVQIL